MKNLKKYKKLISWILIFGVLFGAWKIYGIYKNANPKVDYEVLKVEKRDLRKTISVDGEVVADYEINLASEIPGIISKVYVKEGDYVKKGQLLMKLKDADYRNQVNSAYVNQKINEAAYEKVKNPNQNLDLDLKSVEDNKEIVAENIQKTKADIQNQIDLLQSDLSQWIRFEIDDYFDHTEFDDEYYVQPTFTYRIKSETEISRLEKERVKLGNEYQKYLKSDKSLDKTLNILNEYQKMFSELYSDSQDFLGFTDRELEQKENHLASLKNLVIQKKNNLIALKTALANLEKQYNSTEITKEKVVNVVNEADLKLAEEKIKAAKVQTHSAYTQLQKTYIRAPKSGVILDVIKEQGEYAAPSQPLIRLASTYKYIDADVPEVDIAKIKKGDEVEIKLDAFRDKIFKGKIDFIYPDKKEIFGVVYYKVKILFDKNDLKRENILPGMTAEIIIPYAEKDNVLAVKRGVAKKDDKGKWFVEELNPNKEMPKDNKFIKKYFEAGFVGDDYIEVKDGLKEGEKVLKIEEIKNKIKK